MKQMCMMQYTAAGTFGCSSTYGLKTLYYPERPTICFPKES